MNIDPISRNESPIRSTLKKWSVINIIAIIVIGVFVLVGWQFDITIFAEPISGLVAMNPTTAVAFIFSGVAFLLMQKKGASKKLRNIGKFLAVLISLIGVCWLLTDMGIVNTGIDNLLFSAKVRTSFYNNRPNIMAPVTAFNFILTGCCLMLLTNKKTALPHYLSLLIGFTALISVIGYAFGVDSFYGVFAFFPMAIHTAICFLLLSTAILFIGNDKGFMAEITSHYGGAQVARILLPMAVLIPILFGMIRHYGERRDLYNTSFGSALFTTATIVVFIIVIWNSLATINQSNHLLETEMGKRKKTEDAIKKIHRQLQQQLNSMQQLMNTSMDVICVIDNEGRFVQVSANCKKIWGYSTEEIAGTRYIDLVHKEDRQETLKVAFKIKVTGNIIDFENRYQKKDGTWLPVLWTAIWSEADNMMYCIAKDGSERKKTEKQQQAYNKRISNILESITDGFLAVDKEWLVTYWNKEAEQILGMPKEHIIGKNLWDVYGNADPAMNMRNKFYTEYHKAVAEQVSVHFEAYMASLGKWFDVNAYPSEDGLSVYFMDITRRKEEEEHLRLLESVITNTTDTVIITDAKAIVNPGPRIIFVNEAFTQMTGYTKDEAIGQSPRMLQGPKSDRVELGRLRKALENGEPCRIETVNYKKDGKEFWVSMSVVPVKNSKRTVSYFIAIERDITENKKYQLAIEDQNKKLREIAWTQSHVVRAPVARIMGLVNLLNDSSTQEKDRADLLNFISSSINELDEVIREIVKKTENVKIESESDNTFNY